MNVLLDTSTLLWALQTPARLSRKAREVLDDPRATLHVSSASAWEVATKHRIGKLPGVGHIVDRWEQVLDEYVIESVAIDASHTIRAGSYRADHADPFDRMIAAHAELFSMTLISSDAAFDLFPVTRVW